MSSAMLKISRPTKIELLRLKKRLALARKFHSMLKDRTTYLMKMYRETLRDLLEKRRTLSLLMSKVADSYLRSLSLHGMERMEAFAGSVGATVSLEAGVRNILGLWVPQAKVSGVPSSSPAIPIELHELQTEREDILRLIVEIAVLEKQLAVISSEIVRLKRIVNTLEKIYIPRLERTIRYLTMKFDELGREEVIRAMRVKRLIIEGGRA